MAEPQPAALVTMKSRSGGKASASARARAAWASARPAWSSSAPQHPRARDPETRGLWKYGEHEGVEQSTLRRRSVPAQLGARRLEERPVPDPGGARGLARPATETEIDVPLECLGEAHPTLGGRPHQVDAAARRVHLLAEHAIGRALRQADPA